MNFQEKLFEATAQLRTRAEALAQAAVDTTRSRADIAARRVDGLRKSLAVLNDAGRQFNQVARRHASRFVKQNSPLVAAVRKDVSQLARTTFTSLTQRAAVKKARKPAAARRRATAGKRSARAA
jgi:hypothetical protein